MIIGQWSVRQVSGRDWHTEGWDDSSSQRGGGGFKDTLGEGGQHSSLSLQSQV